MTMLFLSWLFCSYREVSGNVDWLLKAKEISGYVLENFSEEETGFFFFTDSKQKDVIFRKKEVYDGATPSGNATMANNIYRLSIIFHFPEWKKRAEKMIISLSNAIIRYPYFVWSLG